MKRFNLLFFITLISTIAHAQRMEICDNGIDDDGDGLTDCEDFDCAAYSTCRVEICDNNIDDDGDGLTDYFDSDCGATPRQIDSLALVALYRATDGDNWTRSNNWLTGPMDLWYGITLNQGRVSALELENNNIHGILPIEINNLDELFYFNLNDNDINGIPENMFLSNSTAGGHMYRNRLTFEDLLAQERVIFKSYPQKALGKDTTVIVNEGQSFTIDLEIDKDIASNLLYPTIFSE